MGSCTRAHASEQGGCCQQPACSAWTGQGGCRPGGEEGGAPTVCRPAVLEAAVDALGSRVGVSGVSLLAGAILGHPCLSIRHKVGCSKAAPAHVQVVTRAINRSWVLLVCGGGWSPLLGRERVASSMHGGGGDLPVSRGAVQGEVAGAGRQHVQCSSSEPAVPSGAGVQSLDGQASPHAGGSEHARRGGGGGQAPERHHNGVHIPGQHCLDLCPFVPHNLVGREEGGGCRVGTAWDQGRLEECAWGSRPAATVPHR